MDEKKKKSLSELQAQHREQNWPMQNWRAWGSWFSWGSPVGLGIFLVCIGVLVWLLSLARFW